MTFIRKYESPLGPMTMACDGTALTGLWFDGQRHFPAAVEGDAGADCAVLDEAARWLDAYFAGQAPDFEPPLAPRGTPFQQSVWALLRQIPRGQATTYAQLARRLGSSARAVGGAVARNPISILVPCHRVLGADGSLTGYAGGVDRKARLLALEGVSLP